MLLATIALAALQIAVPPPTGHVNDLASILDSASIRHMEAVAQDIRAKTRGDEIADHRDQWSPGLPAVQQCRREGSGRRATAREPFLVGRFCRPHRTHYDGARRAIPMGPAAWGS